MGMVERSFGSDDKEEEEGFGAGAGAGADSTSGCAAEDSNIGKSSRGGEEAMSGE